MNIIYIYIESNRTKKIGHIINNNKIILQIYSVSILMYTKLLILCLMFFETI